jgi:hypothetical protein
MIGATTLALFFVPLFYYLVIIIKERFSKGKSTSDPESSDAGDAPAGEEA